MKHYKVTFTHLFLHCVQGFFIGIILASIFNSLYAATSNNLFLQNSYDFVQVSLVSNTDSLFYTDPSIHQERLPNPPSLLQMQEQQLDLMKKEYRGNPAQDDLIKYKQNEALKEIQKDSTLQIESDKMPTFEAMAETGWHEFVIQYAFKIVDEIPYGEEYKITIPLAPLYLNSQYKQTKVCTIDTKENSFDLTIYPHYTKAEMQASKRKQIQYLLYNFLQQYQHEILECLMLNQAHLDDMNITMNLMSRTTTIAYVRSYVLVEFHGGVLQLKVFNPKDKKSKKE